MPVIGHIDQYNEVNEDWTSYVERLQQYFLANDIIRARQAPAIINLMGSITYKVLKQLAASRKPSQLTFDEIVSTLEDHLSPKPLVISERFRFYKRDQRENESIAAYIAELKGLTEHCNFGAFLTEALSMECAAQDTVQLKGKDLSDVNKFTGPERRQQRQVRKKCTCCGGSSHSREDCWYKNETCNTCGMKGHLKRACRNKRSVNSKQDVPTFRHNEAKRSQKKFHYVEDQSDTGNSEESDNDNKLVWVNTLSVVNKPNCNNKNVCDKKSESNKDKSNISDTEKTKQLVSNATCNRSVCDIKVLAENENKTDVNVRERNDIIEEGNDVNKVDNVIWINVKVENKDIQMELDTGSAVSIMPLTLFKSKYSHIPLSKCNVTLPTYTGEHIQPIGKADVNVRYEGQCKMLNYYSRFLPNLATVLHPLYELQKKDKKWNWTSKCQSAFEKVKSMISSADVMVHFDNNLPVRLACDASSYGIGAVISHVMPHGDERPIAFGSRSLSKAESNYAQIEREALSIVYGVKKFHSYLFGLQFTLITDHKPLVTILRPKSSIPPLAAQRMQRWALILTNYDYSIEYRNTKSHCNADVLSRVPLNVHVPEPKQEADVFSLTKIETLPVTCTEIAKATRVDKILSKVYLNTLNGWTDNSDDSDLRPYFVKREELSRAPGCLMWGIRVIVPFKLRQRILDELHSAHTGIVKMKTLARSYVYWPSIDADLERVVKSCEHCLSIRNNPTLSPLHPWSFPNQKWRRIHIDYAGPFLNKMFFVIIDSYSKWAEVFVTDSTTTDKTIEFLLETFSRYGIPDQVVSDNGPQFTADLFTNFMVTNGIRHIKSAPYHPATNGQAERFIGTMKSSLKANHHRMSIKMNLANFLLFYRNTPHRTTGESPAKLFFGESLRTRLDLLRPDLQRKVHLSQTDAILQRKESLREFSVHDPVIRNYAGGRKWIPGHITSRQGSVNYHVGTDQNTVHKRHIEQIIGRDPTSHTEQDTQIPESTQDVTDNDTTTERRYPLRERKPLERLDL